MAAYQINRGVGRPVELLGLRAQYVIYLVCLIFFSLLISFIISTIIDAVLALSIGIVAFLLSVWSCFFLNRVYGEHGLMQYFANKSVVKHILFQKRVFQIVEDRDEKDK